MINRISAILHCPVHEEPPTLKTPIKMALASAALTVITGCATGPVSQADRDTTGAYEGVWIGDVSKPRSSTEMLPGNWRMTCDWEPFQVYMVVDDGQMQLGKLEQRTPVSTKGKFQIVLSSGAAGMTGGVMQGNGKYLQKFTGSLAGSAPGGKYQQIISSIGGNGCSGKIQFRRYDAQES